MRANLLFVSFFLVFLVTIVFKAPVGALAPATSSIIKVPDDYSAIQTAINAATDGDVIFVMSGTYYENVIVNKTIFLIGEDRNTTIVNGGGRGSSLRITVDHVVVEGFMISNAGGLVSKSGVFLDNVNGCVLNANTVASNQAEFGGIFLSNSSGNLINNNLIFENGVGPPLSSGGGITLTYDSNDNTIVNNQVFKNKFAGIVFIGGDRNLVRANSISESEMGITLFMGSNNTIIDNTIASNFDRGIDISDTHNTIRNNRISKNARGVTIRGSAWNIVEGNLITDNHAYGISLADLSANNLIVGNTIQNNLNGMFLEYSSGSIHYRNNFISNTASVYIYEEHSVNTWNNSAEGNYWSDYAGEDTNGDGIGETPYVIGTGNIDNCPLAQPWSLTRVFNASWNGIDYPVTFLSNSTIAGFSFDPLHKQILFNATGPQGSVGYAQLAIPKTLLRDNVTQSWIILVDDAPKTATISSNETHSIIYIAYNHTTHTIAIIGAEVVPEFPEALIPLTITLITTISAMATYTKRKKP